MTKKSVLKTEKVNPEMEAASQELEAAQAETTIACRAIARLVTVRFTGKESTQTSNTQLPIKKVFGYSTS